MNRYEQILTKLVVAQIAAGFEPTIAVESAKLRKCAAILESHFQARDMAVMRRLDENVPALLKPQAE